MSEHATVASTHEPAPTGEGAVILDFAVRRAALKARVSKGQGYPKTAEALETVSEALTARAEMGKAKYGTYLRANNGRNALVDEYQEVLDALMYAEQCYYEAYGDGLNYKNSDEAPLHLKVGAGTLETLYTLAAEIAPHIKRAL